MESFHQHRGLGLGVVRVWGWLQDACRRGAPLLATMQVVCKFALPRIWAPLYRLQGANGVSKTHTCLGQTDRVQACLLLRLVHGVFTGQWAPDFPQRAYGRLMLCRMVLQFTCYCSIGLVERPAAVALASASTCWLRGFSISLG